MNLAQYIDHTLLRPTATSLDIINLCSEAIQHQFYAVCVNGCYVELAQKQLKDTGVKLAAVIGFPLGAMSTTTKVAEAKYCAENGADEIDMVINLGWLKEGLNDDIIQEILLIKEAIQGKILKVIIETCFLNEEEKIRACNLIVAAKGDFVKTSTGFGTGGATLEDAELIKNTLKGLAAIKASGGIKDRSTALRYIEMGISRIGTSSGINIIKTRSKS